MPYFTFKIESNEMNKMERKNKVLFIILLVCSILIFLSQNFSTQGQDVLEFFDWVTYEVTPGNWVHVSYQDSFMGQVLFGYFPALVGGLAILAAILIFANIHASRISCIITGILTIIAYIIFILPSIILQLVGSYIPFPNLAGAYFFLIPGILVLILGFFLKKTEIGYAREDKEYYAIEKKPAQGAAPIAEGPTILCPHCGATIRADQAFCEECGEFL